MYTEQQMNAFEMVVEIKKDYKMNVINPKGDMAIFTAEEIHMDVRKLRRMTDRQRKSERDEPNEQGNGDSLMLQILSGFMSNINTSYEVDIFVFTFTWNYQQTCVVNPPFVSK